MRESYFLSNILIELNSSLKSEESTSYVNDFALCFKSEELLAYNILKLITATRGLRIYDLECKQDSAIYI